MLCGLDQLQIHTTSDYVNLSSLAASIRASSNFRFAWQFYKVADLNLWYALDIRRAFDAIVSEPSLHAFLRDTFDAACRDAFTISPLHEHCSISQCNHEFSDVLARAANDHLGAYSRELRESTQSEMQTIDELFSSIGQYAAYTIVPGTVPSCGTCRDSNHFLFTNWFDDVAWDYCYFVSWPNSNLLWLGCFTDTD